MTNKNKFYQAGDYETPFLERTLAESNQARKVDNAAAAMGEFYKNQDIQNAVVQSQKVNPQGRSKLVSTLLASAVGLSVIITGCGDQKVSETNEHVHPAYFVGEKSVVEGNKEITLYNGKKASIHYRKIGDSITYFGVPYQGFEEKYGGTKLLSFGLENHSVIKGQGNPVALEKGTEYDVTSCRSAWLNNEYDLFITPAVKNIGAKK